MIRSRSILCTLLLAGLPATAYPATLALGGHPVRVADVLFVGPAVQMEPQPPVTSPDCPVERTIPLINGQEAAGGAWPATWPAGTYTAAIAVVDRCGRRIESAPVTFQVDAAAPTVRWELAEDELFEDYGEPLEKRRSLADRRERRKERQRQRRAEKTLSWSADGRGWIPVGDPLPGQPAEQAGELRIENSRPQLFLRGPGTVKTADGDVVLEKGKVLRVYAEDAESGAARMSIKVRKPEPGQSGGQRTLDVEAVDLVGNPQQLEWPVTEG